MPMTSRERLLAVYYDRPVDRTPLHFWGADWRRELLSPAYQPAMDLALAKADLFVARNSPCNVYGGSRWDDVVEEEEVATDSPAWVDVVATWHTPAGDLRSVYRRSTGKEPGYQKEHLLKEPGDIRKLLSLPYEAEPLDLTAYRETEARLGDRGVVFFGLDHAMYALQRQIGSENFALWSLDADDLMREAMAVFAERLRDHARRAIAGGVRGIFGWVGPELCIPPLMPPSAFDRYVADIDRPLIDLIHDAGGRIWVHCHGGMDPVLERFRDLGVDVLNPLEPPPMGNIPLDAAFARVGRDMGLEGNIETHDFMTGDRESLRPKIHAALEAGQGCRHILSPSSGFMHSTEPTQREIDNWCFFIEEAIRYAEKLGD